LRAYLVSQILGLITTPPVVIDAMTPQRSIVIWDVWPWLGEFRL